MRPRGSAPHSAERLRHCRQRRAEPSGANQPAAHRRIHTLAPRRAAPTARLKGVTLWHQHWLAGTPVYEGEQVAPQLQQQRHRARLGLHDYPQGQTASQHG
jgi:hypothetical protein